MQKSSLSRRSFISRAAKAAFLLSAETTISGAAFAEYGALPFPVKDMPTVVDFGAEWCAACPEMARRMSILETECQGRAAFVVINIDDYPGIETLGLFEVVPTQLFYDRAGKLAWSHRGTLPLEEARRRIETLVAG